MASNAIVSLLPAPGFEPLTWSPAPWCRPLTDYTTAPHMTTVWLKLNIICIAYIVYIIYMYMHSLISDNLFHATVTTKHSCNDDLKELSARWSPLEFNGISVLVLTSIAYIYIMQYVGRCFNLFIVYQCDNSHCYCLDTITWSSFTLKIMQW